MQNYVRRHEKRDLESKKKSLREEKIVDTSHEYGYILLKPWENYSSNGLSFWS